MILIDTELQEVQEAAKTAEKGIWAPDAGKHVREVIWEVDPPRQLVDRMKGKPVSAIIENVRDGSTVRAFLLPDYHHITLMMSGVKVRITWCSVLGSALGSYNILPNVRLSTIGGILYDYNRHQK